MAARAGQADVVRYLLKNGANVDTKSKVSAPSLDIAHCQRDKTMKYQLKVTWSFTAGRPDSAAHLQSAGESGNRSTAAALWRLGQRCHHLGLHPTSPGRPRRTPRCGRHAAGEQSFARVLDKGEWSRRTWCHTAVQTMNVPLVGTSSLSFVITCISPGHSFPLLHPITSQVCM